MNHDAIRPQGEGMAQARRPADQSVGAGTGRAAGEAQPSATQAGGARAAACASKFVGRVSRLDVEAVRATVDTWRQVMRTDGDAWFAAERAAAHAVLASGRAAAQEVLLEAMGECFRRAVWYSRQGALPLRPAEARVGTTEASGQYVATIAMIALLVRDLLTPMAFSLLYQPFAAPIPVEELERE